MPERRPPHPVDDPHGRDVADPGDPDPRDVLARLRPPPPRTWRDRLDDAVADPPAVGRVAAGVAVALVVLVVGWRLLVPPGGPPEDDLPLAQPVVTGAAGAGAGATGSGPGAGAGAAGASGSGGPAGFPGSGHGATSTPGATEVVVHVVGAVAAPGVQRLPVGARVVDAIDAAGGANSDADLARVNLAAVLADGQQVVVPRPGEPAPAPVAPAAPGGGAEATGSGAAAPGAPIDINTASATELEELPGVGPATAEAIISHREQMGPFTSVDDLLDVRGIGEAKLEQLRDRATV